MATQLLRAVGLGFQDDVLAALETVRSIADTPAEPALGSYAIATLCRFGYWRLGRSEALLGLPRQQPTATPSRSRAFCAVVDLSIEAAVGLEHLQVSTAKQLATDALAVAEGTKAPAGLAAIPACLALQFLYEEGRLDEGRAIALDRLPAINAEGSIDCALRAYLFLARVARLRGQYDHSAIVLHEAELLGVRRRWPRLTAACAFERVSLFLDAGRLKEAQQSVQMLERHAEAHPPGFGFARAEITRYSVLARSRVAWAESRSPETAVVLRRLYHDALDRGDLYTGCRLAIELSGMLLILGETERSRCVVHSCDQIRSCPRPLPDVPRKR